LIVGQDENPKTGDLLYDDGHVGKITAVVMETNREDSVCSVVWLNHWGQGSYNLTGKTMRYYLDDIWAYYTIVRPQAP
jgi:hypothetical protein